MTMVLLQLERNKERSKNKNKKRQQRSLTASDTIRNLSNSSNKKETKLSQEQPKKSRLLSRRNKQRISQCSFQQTSLSSQESLILTPCSIRSTQENSNQLLVLERATARLGQFLKCQSQQVCQCPSQQPDPCQCRLLPLISQGSLFHLSKISRQLLRLFRQPLQLFRQPLQFSSLHRLIPFSPQKMPLLSTKGSRITVMNKTSQSQLARIMSKYRRLQQSSRRWVQIWAA